MTFRISDFGFRILDFEQGEKMRTEKPNPTDRVMLAREARRKKREEELEKRKRKFKFKFGRSSIGDIFWGRRE
jgi:hypothetical protein